MYLRICSELEWPVEWRNPIGVDGEFDCPCFAGNASDESPLFEPNQHGIHGRGCELEETQEIGMAGRHPSFIPHHVFADKGQELPLPASRAYWRRRA